MFEFLRKITTFCAYMQTLLHFFENLFIQIPLYRLFCGFGERGIGDFDVVELAEERQLRIDGAEDCAAEIISPPCREGLGVGYNYRYQIAIKRS